LRRQKWQWQQSANVMTPCRAAVQFFILFGVQNDACRRAMARRHDAEEGAWAGFVEALVDSAPAGATRFNHLEPTQVLDGFVRTLNGLINGVLDRSGRGAGKFDQFIDVVFHVQCIRWSRVRSQ
jgi:hypothetical protein